jgi:S-DNA-T family DNA segregation ATPase FtsK/SpoIIIE
LKKVSLFFSIVSLVLAVVALLPIFVPEDIYHMIPLTGELDHLLALVHNAVIPYGAGEFIQLYLISIYLGVVALFFVLVRSHFFYWWIAPYSALIYYSLFLIFQLIGGYNEPKRFLDRLVDQPVVGLIFIGLLILIELLIGTLLLIGSMKIQRSIQRKRSQRELENKRVTPKVVTKREKKRLEKKEAQKTKKEKSSNTHKKRDKEVTDPVDIPSTTTSTEVSFPEVKETPIFKTFGSPVEQEKEVVIEPVQESKAFHLSASLRERLQKERQADTFVVPSSIPQVNVPHVSSPSVVPPTSDTTTEVEPPAPVAVPPKVEEIQITQEDDDVDSVSGVGGLVSSALLSRHKTRYNNPPEELLDTYPDHSTAVDESVRASGEDLINTLKQFKIEATLLNIVKGPTVTMFEVSPAPGVRVSSIIGLSDNIALQLAAKQVRIVAPIPGKQAVGIEVPNKNRSIIGFKDLLSTVDSKQYNIPMILGRKITGEPEVIELTQTPHLLIAGATGSGKSVCVNSLISTILYRRSPKEVRLILVDPKIVELRVYNGIPHLLTPVITEPKKTIKALEFCLYEMERRYKLLNGLAVRNISAYNKKVKELKLAREQLPYIVVIIDEFADLMTTVGKELETLLARLAAMARAIGIHLVLATQRPSANVITGIIKSNIPTRIAFMVASQVDSRIIIDEVGAEKLLGRGDMLFASGWDPNSIRIQGAFLSDEEVERIVEYAKTQGEPDYLDEGFFEDDEVEDDDLDTNDGDDSDDVLYEKAKKIVTERQSASASYLQRRLKIGYNRAARLVEQMEEEGIVGPARGSKPRELLRYPD